jgi:5-methylcytosine-specific restriction endonuclease McrA
VSEHSWPQPKAKRYRGKYPKVSSLKNIYERDQGVCHICDEHVEWEDASRDHITPVSHGGSYWPKNLKLAHKSCNRMRATLFIGADKIKTKKTLLKLECKRDPLKFFFARAVPYWWRNKKNIYKEMH